jgi:hypothetical protein
MNCFLQVALLFVVVSMGNSVYAQDERFYRKIFTGELFDVEQEKPIYKVVAMSPLYKIDLNRDGVEEGIIIEKKDGMDFLTIIDRFGRPWFNQMLDTMGGRSKIYKIQLKSISKTTDALIVHFYEGHTNATIFEATARLYFVTIDKRDLRTLRMFKGPHMWHEKEMVADKYWNRYYSVNVKDYNGDGRREISVSYNKISRIYFYLEDGRWKKI